MDVRRTPGYRAVSKRLFERQAKHTTILNLNWYTTLFVLPPEISRLNHLKFIFLQNSPVQDLSPISGLALHGLTLDGTRVVDIAPLAHMTPLQDAAMAGIAEGGLSYSNTPLAKQPPFDVLVKLNDPARTVETINEVRRRLGLSQYIPKGYKPPEDFSIHSVEPLPNIPTPFGFQISGQQIRLTSSSINWPTFPLPTSPHDYESRLEAARTLAVDLALELREGRFNARPDYSSCLTKYAERLPNAPGSGNILLADAEARTLRNMFAADVDILPTGFASKLKTILEQHIGLRVYYPEIEMFYRDVRSGRIEASLSLDAVEGFIREVRNHAPAVFNPEVSEAVGASAQGAFERGLSKPSPVAAAHNEQPKAPPDPLGELDPHAARDFTFAGAVNALWKVFREGEKVNQALEGWKSAGKSLRPHVQEIIDWLSSFTGSTN